MILVPAGEFWMGCDESLEQECSEDQLPYRSVYLDAYWIDEHEVTVSQFKKFVNETGYKTLAEKTNKGWVFKHDDLQKSSGASWRAPWSHIHNIHIRAIHPVVQMAWKDAAAYCAWCDKRLPTEAEWEKAARGTDARIHPWGDDPPLSGYLNLSDVNSRTKRKIARIDDGYRCLAPVATYPKGASPYGLLDMAGNVAEWCADWYDPCAYGASSDRNPTGPSSGEEKVLRGGAWMSTTISTRTFWRDHLPPDRCSDIVGFRCAKSADR